MAFYSAPVLAAAAVVVSLATSASGERAAQASPRLACAPTLGAVGLACATAF